MKITHSVDVLWSGCVGTIGSVALEGEVIFGSEKKKETIRSTWSWEINKNRMKADSYGFGGLI